MKGVASGDYKLFLNESYFLYIKNESELVIVMAYGLEFKFVLFRISKLDLNKNQSLEKRLFLHVLQECLCPLQSSQQHTYMHNGGK